ncbi:hypothetical protein [Actinoplanes sp. NPDC026619]|uniref:hypothetical protein n=1 Tax=Actinoplanes sp. NPDC026619 TaxID=3155798 RepID=UPI0033DA49A0
MPPSQDQARPYGLSRPTMSDAREAVHRVHGDSGPRAWAEALQAAGLSGEETAPEALDRLLAVLAAGDEVSQLCGHALQIRAAMHTHLSAAHALTRS